VSYALWPHGLQQGRLPCPSWSPRVCWNSCSLSWWCYLTISFPAPPISFCLRPFLASGSFPLSWLFISGGQRIGASASALVLPVNIQGWFLLGLICLIPLQCKGLSSWTSPAPQFKSISSWGFSHLYVQLSHPYMTTGKTVALTLWTFVSKAMSLLFNTLSRFVIVFL